MTLVYLGYLQDDQARPPTPEQQSEYVTRRLVSLGLALMVLVLLGLFLGPIAVIVVAVVSAGWWALASRADRRRDAAASAKRPDDA